MATKKRGLGRGLQALIPEAQAENPATRPTDVFFPASRRPSSSDAASEATRDESSSSRAADLASTLLAPPKRMSAAKKSSKRSTKDGVSRETSSAPTKSAEAVNATVTRTDGRGTAPVSDASSAPVTTHERAMTQETSATGYGNDDSYGSSANNDAALGSETQSADTVEMMSQTSTSVESVDDGDADNDGLVPVPGATFADLPVERIVPNPRQPRTIFDEDEIAELAASIAEVGLLQPIVVRRIESSGDDSDDGLATYELVMGERRLRASKEAGLTTIPAVVRYTDDDNLLRDALLENLHRVQLNPLEEAAAYQQLLEDFQCTHAELSTRIARSRSQISNTLRLMKLPPLVQRRLAAGVLSAGHARALLGLPDAAAMERLAQRIVAEGLSVRATEELVALDDEPVTSHSRGGRRTRSRTLPDLSSRLSDVFDTRVKVTQGVKKGKITIEFAGEEDLARLIATLAPGTALEQ